MRLIILLLVALGLRILIKGAPRPRTVHRPPLEEQPIPAAPVLPVLPPLPPLDQATAYYFHARNKARLRYNGLWINRATWEIWNTMIRTQAPGARFLENRREGAQLWMLTRACPVPMFVVFRDGMVVTVLKNASGQFDALIQGAIQRAREEEARAWHEERLARAAHERRLEEERAAAAHAEEEALRAAQDWRIKAGPTSSKKVGQGQIGPAKTPIAPVSPVAPAAVAPAPEAPKDWRLKTGRTTSKQVGRGRLDGQPVFALPKPPVAAPQPPVAGSKGKTTSVAKAPSLPPGGIRRPKRNEAFLAELRNRRPQD